MNLVYDIEIHISRVSEKYEKPVCKVYVFDVT